MTSRFRPSRPLRFAAVTTAALGLGVPAALALTDAPDRPKLQEPVVRSSAGTADVDDDEITTTTTAPADTTPTSSADDDAHHEDAVDAVEAAEDESAEDESAEDEAGEDVSGSCDEAEHAGDPECTGATPTAASAADDEHDDHDDDGEHAGRSHGDESHDDDHDDRSGSDSTDD